MRRTGRLSNQSGITFISAIFAVVLIGVMLAMTGQSWHHVMRNEREKELLFRGDQYFQAISSWYRVRHHGVTAMPLKDVKDLLKDPRYLANVRHLRALYTDPVTGKEFEPVKCASDGSIIGVKSTSQNEPLQTSFLEGSYKHFNGKKKYSEWLFVPVKQRIRCPETQSQTSSSRRP